MLIKLLDAEYSFLNGIFQAYIERLRKELSLTPNGRFPLTWIMEAADDISYCGIFDNLRKQRSFFMGSPCRIKMLIKLLDAEYSFRKELSLTPNGRFPLTWIMEAADDISYCVADLEDAVRESSLRSRSI
jgi:dGTP triphosphohydrolase